jgi:hypothetical protein
LTKAVYSAQAGALGADAARHLGRLEGEHLLPGFGYFVADLFKEWDW